MLKKLLPYLLAVGGVAAVTLALAPFAAGVNATTVALGYLLVVLFVAAVYGSRPAFAASFAGVGCFNYFFLPPIGSFTIADSQNWVALGAFLLTAIIAGQLSSYARRRATEAETLYQKLQIAFEKASQAEALRQSEKLKSALLDAVTHDLRTPLTSIKAAVTGLIDDERETEFRLDAEGRGEFLEIINEETDRLNKFIEGMVELARQEAGTLALKTNWSAPEEIIAAAVERAQKSLRKHRVQLDIEKDLPLVRVDAKALAEAVYTLLDNAAKYSPAGSNVTVTARRAVAEELVEIAVNDEGRGVAEEKREQVFDKFYTAGTDENQSSGGLGLGLAIARGIVEAHDGRIWIADGDGGRGAKVILNVPIGE